MMKNVLIVSQAISQWYVDTLTKALGKDTCIDIITGSSVKGNVVNSPSHNAKSLKSRLISWCQYYRFVMHWARQNKKRRYDIVFATSNPPINSVIGLKLKRIFKSKFIYMNWDLYPQVIEKSIKNPVSKILCSIWRYWNSYNYPKIDKMITLGNIMADCINRELKHAIGIDVIPVPADTERLRPIDKKDNRFISEHNLENKFIILYSGKMGLGHNIELILEASVLLKDIRDIHFVFIGSGQKYETVASFIAMRNPQNVSLFPLQPDDIFPYSIACGDVGVVTQEQSMAHLFMPSKTYSMMACGEAIIGVSSEHDDLSELIRNNNIGYCVMDNSAETLAHCIRRLYDDSSLLKKMKTNSRRTAVEKYNIDIVVKNYEVLFNGLK